MDKSECRTFTVNRPITVKMNAAWPKYRMFCGILIRIRSPLEAPECLIENKWRDLEVGESLQL